jgi:acyl carrier protein
MCPFLPTGGGSLRMSVRSEVIALFQQLAEEHNRKLAPLADDLPLLESGLDSLCFAVMVARLEDVLGVDPFIAAGDDAPFPVTVGDFIKAYEDAHEDAAK